MAYEVINTGTGLGQRDGDLTPDAWGKAKRMFIELYALVGGGGTGYLAVVITAASTDDYAPGGGFPTNLARLDINPTTNDITLTGLLAGTDGQTVSIRNIGSTYTITLTNESSSSLAANRFDGEGDATIPPGAMTRITYYSLPSPRWAVG